LDYDNVNSGEVEPDSYSSENSQDTIICNEHRLSEGVDGHCQCTLKCSEQIMEDRQRQLHSNFYATADWAMQSAYVAGHVRVSSKTRTYTVSESSRRSNSLKYFLSDSDGLDIHVCKAFFKGVIGVSDGRISRVLKKKVNGTPLTDNRGNHVPHNKTSDAELQYVREFIGKFPTYTSHYSRKKNPNRSYLTPDMNISKMYELLKGQYREDRPLCEPIIEHVFRYIFNHEVNLHFHAPLQDTCKTCDTMNAKIKACDTENDLCKLKFELEIHQRKADSARTSLQEDTARSKILENDITVLTFDLQKTLPTPVLSTGICYYKHQLWTYNLGIHCMNNDVGYMYVWDESEASRGPEEIASALLYHIKKHVKTTNLICYSDCCGGQNRNIKMALMWNNVVLSDETIVNNIDNKFLIPGHTYLPNDQDFGLIEKNKKYHSDIFVPTDWIRVIQSAKKRKPEFIVTKLTKSDFFATKQLEENSTNRKTDENGQKVMWLKIHWLHFNKLHPYRIDFKYCVNEDAPFMSVDVGKRKRGRQQDITNVALSLLYPDGKRISKAKILDLKSLMPFVPQSIVLFTNS
jgi:hypothetical protein